MNALDLLATALIVLAVVDWFFTAILLVSARYLPEPALSERAAVGVICSLAATLFAVLGAVRLDVIALPPGASLVLLAAGAIAISAPQVMWGFAFITGRLK